MSALSLHEKLKSAKTEEDVKDIYIKALGIKKYSKGLVDISTDEIWFEAKDKGTSSTYKMFTQLLFYVQKTMDKGEHIPPLLAVIDTEKAAIMKTENALPLLKKKTIKWGKRPSDVSHESLEEVSAFIGTYLVSFRIETHEKEFIETVKAAIKTGEIIRTQITPDNLKQVFDKWVEMIGREIGGVQEDQYNLLFFADIMSDGSIATHENLPAKLVHVNGQPAFFLNGKMYELGSKEGYRQFWAIYHRPPEKEYRDYLLERRDSLIPLDERSFKGAYYTPLHVVDKAYDTLADLLGKNWQREYIVWDMCCGVGNLEVKHSNPRNVFMSTLDQADVDVMIATKTCVSATRFQYDYLNDDINEFGQIDYSITGKVPQGLRDAIAQGRKILVLINPPYAEVGSGIGKGDKNKKEVEQTKVNASMNLGYASKELFVQFMVRIAQEIPTATLAMFSTLKYVNAPNFEEFRESWKAKYLGGFIVHSKAFDGLKGEFPIGFLAWKTNNTSLPTRDSESDGGSITEITAEVLDKNGKPIGEKRFYNLPKKMYLNAWIKKLNTNNQLALPLSNAITVSINPRIKMSCDNAKGFLFAGNNDFQNASTGTLITSSIYTGRNGGGTYLDEKNLWQAAIVFSVRRLIKPTWINDRDQFLQPTEPLSDEFKQDCLIWMLFNGSNLTASADGLEWNGHTWSIVNHFIPFTEEEVGARGRFESDFMVRYLSDKILSPEAQAVLDAGRVLWQAYFTATDPYTVREELKLNRPDVGWYQIRNALKRRNEAGDGLPVDFKPFETAYNALSAKLRPLVFELGFLRD